MNIKDKNHWYDDFELNQVLSYYFKDSKNTAVLYPVSGKDTKKGNMLADSLTYYLKEGDKKDKVIIPVNIRESHWIMVYVFSDAAYYFDPYGGQIMDKEVVDAINKAGISKVVNVDIRVQDKFDNYNCGVYVVEAARSLGLHGYIPGDIDVQAKRNEHAKIYAESIAKNNDELIQREAKKLAELQEPSIINKIVSAIKTVVTAIKDFAKALFSAKESFTSKVEDNANLAPPARKVEKIETAQKIQSETKKARANITDAIAQNEKNKFYGTSNSFRR